MTVVGTAQITVTAVSTGFKKQLKDAFREARPIAAQEGDRYGKAFGDRFKVHLKKATRDAFTENRDWVKAEGGRQGKAFGKEFSRTARAELKLGIGDLLARSLNPEGLGKSFGEKFADAAKKGARDSGTITADDIIRPGAGAPARGPAPAVGGGGAPAGSTIGDFTRLRQQIADQEAQGRRSARRRTEEARASAEELQRLAEDHEERLAELIRKSADDAEALDDSVLRHKASQLAKALAMDEAWITEHLGNLRNSAAQEEQIAQHIVDVTAEQQRDMQALYEETAEKAQRAADAAAEAQLQQGGRSAARKKAAELQEELKTAQDVAEQQSLAAQRADREALEAHDQYRLALDRIDDRVLDVFTAKQQKKSQVAAKRALQDAQDEARIAEKAAASADRFRDLATARAVADLEEVAAARARLERVQVRPGGISSSRRAIAEAREALDALRALAAEAEADRDAADARELAAARKLTEAKAELADREDALASARGRRRVADATRDRNVARGNVVIAGDEAGAAAEGASIARVRHQRIVFDVDRRSAEVDLSEAGRRSAGSFGKGFSQNFRNEAETARKAFLRAFAIGNVMGPGIATAIAAVGSLAAGLGSLASVAAEAAGSLVVLPALIGALGQAGLTAMVALKGVGSAISAGFKAADAAQAGAGGGDGGAAAKAQASAISDARKNLGRAYEDAAKRIRDADEGVRDAEKALIKDQAAARIAQLSLTAARKAAIETVQQLGFSVEEAALSEEEAVLNLEKATQALAEINANPSSTAQEVQEASLNYRRAELQVRETADAYSDIKEKAAEAAKAGIEGSPEVVAAQNEIIDANNQVADSEERLSREREDRVDAERQNARAISDAQEALTRAMERQASGIDKAASAADAYQQALAKLSPGARAFVEYVVSLKDELKVLQDAAGEQLFGPLKTDLQAIVQNTFPALQNMLRITGGALADFAESITEVLTSSGFLARFTQIAEDNTTTISRFGEIIASVINGISGVLVAAGPLVDRFTSFLTDKAEDFERFATSGEGIEKMANFFQKAGDTAAKFGEIIGNVVSALIGLGEAAEPAGQTMLDKFIEMSQGFEDFTTGIEGKTQLTDYFTEAGENAGEVTGLIWDLIKAVGSLGNAPGVGESAKTLRDQWVPTLQRIGEQMADAGGALADLIVRVTDLAATFADSASSKVFLGMLALMVKTLTAIVEIPAVRFFLDLVLPVLALGHALQIAFVAGEFFVKAMAGALFAITRVMEAVSLASIAVQVYAITIWETVAAEAARAVATVTSAAAMEGATVWTIALSVASAAGSIAIKGLSAALAFLAANPIVAVVAVLGLAIAGIMAWSNSHKKAREEITKFKDTLDETTGAITDETRTAFAKENISDGLQARLSEIGVSLETFLAAVTGGKAEMAALEDAMDAAGVGTKAHSAIVADATELHKKWTNQRGQAEQQWNREKEVTDAASGGVLNYAEAAKIATRNITDMGEAQKVTATLTADLKKQTGELIDDFTTLNKGAISQDRLNERVEAGYDELASTLQTAKTATDDLTVSSLDGGAALAIGTEAGRANRAGIREQVEALDEQFQGQLKAAQSSADAAGATAAARTEYEKSIEKLKEHAVELGIDKGKVDEYVGSILKTPEEWQTDFTIIFQQAQVQAIVAQMDFVTAGRVLTVYAQSDDKSMQGLLNSIEAVALSDPTVVFTPQLQALAAEDLSKKMQALLLDPKTNQPYTPDVLPKANIEAYNTLQDQLAAITKTDTKHIDVVAGEIVTTTVDNYEPEGKTIPVATGKPDTSSVDDLDSDTEVIVVKRSPRAQTGRRRSASGGPITGPGTSTSDSIPAMLSNGEFVLSAAAVRAMGGMAAAVRLQKKLLGGGSLPKFATGGAVTNFLSQPFQTTTTTTTANRTVNLTSTVFAQANKPSITRTKEALDSTLLDDETNKDRVAKVLSNVANREYKGTDKKLNALMFKPDGNKRDPQYLPEADRDRYNELQDELDALLTDPVTGEPRDPQYLPENDRIAYDNIQRELNALLTKPGGAPYDPTYYPTANSDAQTRTRTRLAELMFDENKKNWAPQFEPYVPKYAADYLIGQLKALGGIVTPVPVYGPQQKTYNTATGGAVYGPGGPMDDLIPAMLSNGEFVLSVRAVEALGGARRVTALHTALRNGIRPMGLSSGGPALARLSRAGGGPADSSSAAVSKENGGSGGGVNVAIGTIVSPSPAAAAREVVASMRAESYRMGQFT